MVDPTIRLVQTLAEAIHAAADLVHDEAADAVQNWEGLDTGHAFSESFFHAATDIHRLAGEIEAWARALSETEDSTWTEASTRETKDV